MGINLPWDLGRKVVPVVHKTSAPATTDTAYNVPTLWINDSSDVLYVLVDVTSGVATWRQLQTNISNMTTSTDPAANAATTAAIVAAYSGVIITTTTTGNSQTLASPAVTTAGRTFTVVNNDTSTNSIPIVANSVTFTVTPGEAQMFIWDGTAWGPIDMGITALPVPYNQGGTGVTDDLANYHIWVDGSRSDTYTADGSMARPYKTVLAALTAINADTGKSWVMNVAAGTYSDNLTITGPRYLSIRAQGGVTLSGTILINSGVGSYDRIEFVGVHGLRAEKGPALTISGKMTCQRADDSLIYLSFFGCYISGELECTTLGTWVVQYEKCRVTGAITGTFTRAAHEQLLLESYGFNEFVGAITGWVSLYNCHDSDFYSNINTTPFYESRFTHCSFSGSVSIVPVVGASSALIYIDSVSYKSLIARTPTLTGATYSGLSNLLAAETLTIGDGYGITMTSEDAAGTITLDNTTLEIENTNATQRAVKIVVGTDAPATLQVEGATSAINQDVTTDGNPQFATVELGHASDTTLTRVSAGVAAVEGKNIYLAGGTDVAVADGGTGASTLTDHGVLVGSGTDAVTALTVGTNGQVLVGSTGADPVFATIMDGEGIDTTLGAGTLTIACEDASTSNKGVVELATNAETATGESTTLVVTPDDVKYRLDATCQNVVEDLSYLPTITFTWDPGSLDDGVGETSSAVTVPGASLGDTMVFCVAPYDLQGITLTAWVDAANSCKARLQNETGGTINLASGTWSMKGRRI